MTDFYPLLARTLAALPEDTPDMRRQVYDRVREALIRQLRAADPPASEGEIIRQRLTLDEAIARIERERGGVNAPADLDALAGAAAPKVPARTGRAATGGGAAHRGLARWLIAGAVLVGTLGLGSLAWIRRDDPALYRAAAPVEPPKDGVAEPADRPKTAARIDQGTGSPAGPADVQPQEPPQEPPKEPVRESPPGETPKDPPPADAAKPADPGKVASATPKRAEPPAAVVAHRATLIRAAADPSKPPEVVTGRAVWQVVDLSPGDGRPPEPTLRIEISFEQLEFSGVLLLRKNRDAALPASHTLEVILTTRGDVAPVTEIQLPQFKDEETVRGAPVFGVPFAVAENLFVVAFSNVERDVARNLDLIEKKSWFDLPVLFRGNRRAMITIERGVSGERAVQSALAAWAK
jgi:hypothetical protein